MRYGLTLDEVGRVLCATYEQYAPDNAVRVDALPDGDITDYRYEDGELIYDPVEMVVPPVPVPTVEQRVTAVEQTQDDMVVMLADLYGGGIV